MLKDANPAATRRPTARSIRARASATRCGRSRRSSRPTSASRSRSPSSASGTTTRTRADRTGQIANRLDDFARGLAAFARDMGDRMADVVVVTMSEFGRTVKENGNRGTDHGHGNAMLILGGNVKGGKVYGKWPGLAGRTALRGPRPGDHDRLPRRLRRMRHGAPGREGHLADLPGVHAYAKLGFIRT